jgi:hypothetical protein
VEEGFVYLETSNSHPGMVRLGASRVLGGPEPPRPGARTDPAIRLIVRFRDVEAGMMHAHNALRRRLVDVDARTYRASLEEGVAAIEAVELPQQRIYLDPELGPGTLATIAAMTDRQHARHGWQDRFWQIVGGLGVGLLVLMSLLGLIR